VPTATAQNMGMSRMRRIVLGFDPAAAGARSTSLRSVGLSGQCAGDLPQAFGVAQVKHVWRNAGGVFGALADL
jgi:hypothetical protein